MARKIALVGIGKIAVDQHIPALAADPDWELAATVSRNGAVDGVETFRDLDTMLARRPDIDVVSLCLPPVPRFAYAVAALKAKRHVMLEKPPGATVSECLTLEKLAREAGVSIYATWHSREAPQVPRAKAFLTGKKLKSLTVTWKEDVRRWHPGQAWIWEPGGLGVFDPGINALSIVTEILPVPIHLASAVLDFPENRATPIGADLVFVHPDGGPVRAVFDWRQDGDQIWSIDAETDTGSMSLRDGGGRLWLDGVEQAAPNADGNPLQGEYPTLYRKMTALVDRAGIDMDLSPLLHVADAFLLGERRTTAPFTE